MRTVRYVYQLERGLFSKKGSAAQIVCQHLSYLSVRRRSHLDERVEGDAPSEPASAAQKGQEDVVPNVAVLQARRMQRILIRQITEIM